MSLTLRPGGSVDGHRLLSRFSPDTVTNSAQLLPLPPSTKSRLKPIDHSPWLKASIISIGKHKHVNKRRFMTHASSCWHREAEGVKKNTLFFQSLALNAAKLGLPFPSLSSTHHHAPLHPHICLSSTQTVRANCQRMRCVNGFYLHNAAPGKGSTKYRQQKHIPNVI